MSLRFFTSLAYGLICLDGCGSRDGEDGHGVVWMVRGVGDVLTIRNISGILCLRKKNSLAYNLFSKSKIKSAT